MEGFVRLGHIWYILLIIHVLIPLYIQRNECTVRVEWTTIGEWSDLVNWNLLQ